MELNTGIILSLICIKGKSNANYRSVIQSKICEVTYETQNTSIYKTNIIGLHIKCLNTLNIEIKGSVF